jgi:catechol 2,3-dioxygenase-like lactoylglutathione lyase family enzyme
MLGNYPIDVVLLAMDLAAAKDFYADKIGLPVRSRDGGRGDVSLWRRQPVSGHEEQRGDQGRADASYLPCRRRARRGKLPAPARREDRRLRPARTQDPGRYCRYRLRLDGLVHRPCQQLRGHDTAQERIAPLLRATEPSSLLRRRTWRTKRSCWLEGSSRGAAEKEKDACIIV